MFVDPTGALTVCGVDFPEKCQGNSVVNNIVAGSALLAYTVAGHKCGDAEN
jgi:hypothetical protein